MPGLAVEYLKNEITPTHIPHPSTVTLFSNYPEAFSWSPGMGFLQVEILSWNEGC